MPELDSRPFAYHIVRYTPNLIRDEWVNVGVVIHDAGEGRYPRARDGRGSRIRAPAPAAPRRR